MSTIEKLFPVTPQERSFQLKARREAEAARLAAEQAKLEG